MSNIQPGAERMPHDLSHLGFLAGQIGRLITISTTPVSAGDSFEMDAVGALRRAPLRRGLAIDSTVDIFTFFFQAEDGIRDTSVTGVQTCALPISSNVASVKALVLAGFGVGEIPDFMVGPAEAAHLVRAAVPHDPECALYVVGAPQRSEERRVGRECG